MRAIPGMMFRPAAALVLLASAACAGAGRSACADDSGRALRPQGQGWYHGPIVSVDSSRLADGGWIRNVMVQVAPAGATTGRISFSVSDGTTLLCRSGAPMPRAVPLVPGTPVSAKTRLILESDPASASTDTLIVGR